LQRLCFAGAAATGKTTTARLLSRRLGLPWFEVEAEKCWSLSAPRERQRCFLKEFKSILSRPAPGFYSNHLLTVYAYSKALGANDVAAEALSHALHEARGLLVVLVADGNAIMERITRRLEAAVQRRKNVVEEVYTLHLRAQEVLVDAAHRHGIPIIDTTNTNPSRVVDKVVSLLAKSRPQGRHHEAVALPLGESSIFTT